MSFLSQFVTLLVLCLVFCVAYWLATLIVSVVPVPAQKPASLVLYGFLGITAIICLLDMAGFVGSRHIVLLR